MNDLITDCYHCGNPIPVDFCATVAIDNIEQSMCCHGCTAVAQTIVDNQLSGYYRHRSEKGVKGSELVPDEIRQLQSYDITEIEQEFTHVNGDSKEVMLTVENVSCAACAWLIERKLSSLNGIEQCTVNTSSARLSLKWQSQLLKLSDILLALAQIGYHAYPFKADVAEANEVLQTKAYLRRLTIAGLATMQIMMFAMAAYFDTPGLDGQGSLTHGLSEYFRYVSLLLALPVVCYSCLPFYKNALSGILAKRLNMDVPVSIAILLAFAASVGATLNEQGDVYFESVCMFAFFLLLGRYMEQSAKRRAVQSSSNLLKLIPSTATLIEGNEYITVPAKTLTLGQRVLVKPGEVIPCDGVIVKGSSHCNEAILTGEPLPVNKKIADWVFASTINNEQAIEVIVEAERANQLITKIIALQEQAANAKPKLATLADTLSQYVVIGILLLSSMTYLGWELNGSDNSLWYALSVLVATCPCALSLATPSAYTVAMTKLQQFGLLAKQGNTLDTLTQIDHICFDKTGTLTTGNFTIDRVCSTMAEHSTLQIIAAIETHSTHPIAAAFDDYISSDIYADNIVSVQGGGISGTVNQTQYFIGSASYIASECRQDCPAFYSDVPAHCVTIFLATSQQIIARIALSDALRPQSGAIISALAALNMRTTLLTGDSSAHVNFVAKTLAISDVEQGQTPSDKLSHLKKLQKQGAVVAMFGDGVNDAPVLSQAHLSFAMGTGADIAKSSADIVVLNDDLSSISDAIILAHRTKSIIKQNFCWALGYNLLAVPFAMAGYLPPYIAAIGMSLSSIIVVTNSLRLLKVR